MKLLALSSTALLAASYAVTASRAAPMQQRPMVLYPGKVNTNDVSSSSASAEQSPTAMASAAPTCTRKGKKSSSSSSAKTSASPAVAAAAASSDQELVEVVVVVVDGESNSTLGTVAVAPSSTPAAAASSGSSSAGSSGSSSSSSMGRCAVQYKGNATLEEKNRALIKSHGRKLSSLKGGESHIKVAASNPVDVPVYFNIINDNGRGDIEDSAVAQQLAVINNDYKDWGFNFTLAKTARHDSSDWFSNAGSDSDLADAMKKKLHQGGAESLNLYTLNFGDGTLGYSTFPWDYEDSPGVDGVVFQYNTVPGGNLTNYNGGRTLTHEVGHWLGLLHTFQGGCKAPGDYVDDTAPQASPTNGCPASRDSCTGDDLPDPIHNYMDYSYDSCMDYFSMGQGARMQALSSKYRFDQ